MTGKNSRLVFLAFAFFGNSAANAQTPPTPSPIKHASPQAVFDAYRIAIEKRDKRSEYLALDVAWREHEVFEAYLLCQVKRNVANIPQIQDKYLSATWQAEYMKRYKVKYGVDYEKLEQDYYRNPSGPRPKADEKLLRRVIVDSIKDPVGFVVDVDAALKARDDPDDLRSKLSHLRDLTIQRDSAFGRATLVDYLVMYGGVGPGPGTRHVDEIKKTVTVRFHKAGDGWLIKSIGPSPEIPNRN